MDTPAPIKPREPEQFKAKRGLCSFPSGTRLASSTGASYLVGPNGAYQRIDQDGMLRRSMKQQFSARQVRKLNKRWRRASKEQQAIKDPGKQ